MTYYNTQNGWTDNGKKLNNRKCPGCRSSRFVESVSREHCPDCGLVCNYWGSGANEVYTNMMHRDAEYERQKREIADDSDCNDF